MCAYACVSVGVGVPESGRVSARMRARVCVEGRGRGRVGGMLSKGRESENKANKESNQIHQIK